MNIRPIKNESDYEAALARLEAIWDPAEGSPEADELEVLTVLIEDYENRHHPVPPPDPVDAILFRMEQQGLTRKDLEPLLGGRARVSEVLNRKRGLSMAMIRRLHRELHIPLDSLVGVG